MDVESNSVARSEPADAEASASVKLTASLTLLTQAILLVIVIELALRDPGTTKSLLSALYLLVSIALGYHQLSRAFFRNRMPPRLERGSPGFRFFRVLLSLDLAFVLIVLIVFFYREFSHPSSLLGHSSGYFVPIILLNNPLLDYLRDRLPPPKPRPRGRPGAKIWDSIKPIRSDHWGERGAS